MSKKFYNAFGQEMTVITARTPGPGSKEYTFPLGTSHGYSRTPGAITLMVSVSCVLPFDIELDLNPDGSWQLREVTTNNERNDYVHFAQFEIVPGQRRPARPPTAQQQETLSKWSQGIDTPYGLSMSPSAPVIEWYAGERQAFFASAYHD